MKEIKIGFIGYGNMAQAIATGLIASKAAAGSRMCACAGNFDKLCRNAEKTGIVPLRTAEEVIENSDFIILCFFHQHLLISFMSTVFPFFRK